MTFTYCAPDRLAHFAYWPEFVAHDERRALEAFLGSVPDRAAAEYDPRREFAFSHPMYDGTMITSRAEAAAGGPVWLEGEATEAVAIPPLLASLGVRVAATFPELPLSASAAQLTSVYVDRYPAGGLFVPHTDRNSYGPAIAGVSVGPGTSVLEFLRPDRSDEPTGVTLRPGSLYVFFGEIREAPWLHRLVSVTDRRFGITYRSAAK